MDPMIQNITKQTQGDRIMLKITQRLHKFAADQWHMNPRELGYCFEKIANYDHVDELVTALLGIVNEQYDSQMIHVLLRILYRQKKTEVILYGYHIAMEIRCKPNILNLYADYLCKLGEANK